MKKLISLLLAALLVLSLTLAASAGKEPAGEYPKEYYEAVKAEGEIVIDGVMDDAYLAAPVVKIDNKIMVDLLYDEADIADGELRILWTEDALYVFFTVNDATYAPPYAETGWFNNVDSVWFAVDASEDLSQTNCYAVPRSGERYHRMNGASPDIEVAIKNLKDGEEVALESYGNAQGNYPADSLKPVGPVDSYVIEAKIPYACAENAVVYFGAFICDDTDFSSIDVINLVDGRSRTSEAVSTERDNGIWNVTGPVSEGKVDDAREFFDEVTLVIAK